MVHTLPDYTSKYKADTIFEIDDVGEAAARLGSIDTFDRRGNIMYLDDFEAPDLRWYPTTAGVGAAVSLNACRARSGDQSVKLVTGNAIDNYAAINKYFQRPIPKRLGAEISFTAIAETKDVHIQFAANYGSVQHIVELQVMPRTAVINYLDENGVYQELDGSYGFQTWNGPWYTIKLVADFLENEYIRVILGGKEYDMTGIPLREVGAGPKWFTTYSISHIAGTNANSTIYVDDFIYTQNEV